MKPYTPNPFKDPFKGNPILIIKVPILHVTPWKAMVAESRLKNGSLNPELLNPKLFSHP